MDSEFCLVKSYLNPDIYDLICLLCDRSYSSFLRATKILEMMTLCDNTDDEFVLCTLNLCSNMYIFMISSTVPYDQILSGIIAINRFVTVISEMGQPYPEDTKSGSAIAPVTKFQLPAWLIAFRHKNTHRSIIRDKDLIFHTMEFCLDWLLKNYWLNSEYYAVPKVENVPFIDTKALIRSRMAEYTQDNKEIVKNLSFKYYMSGKRKYRRCIEFILENMINSPELSPSKWADSQIEAQTSKFPLYHLMFLGVILTSAKFHYYCSRWYYSSTWSNFLQDLKIFLVRLYSPDTQYPEHERNVIKAIIESSLKNSPDVVYQDLLKCVLSSLDTVNCNPMKYYNTLKTELCSEEPALVDDVEMNNVVEGSVSNVNTTETENCDIEYAYTINGYVFYEVPLGKNFWN